MLHDRPTYWACDRRNWPGVRPPTQLPNQSTLSRRLKKPDTLEMLQRITEQLDTRAFIGLWKMIDGKPLTVARHSQDRQSTFGYGAGGKGRGYKFHAIYTGSNRPVAWSVQPLNIDERQVAKDLTAQLQDTGYIIGDRNYDANTLYDQADQVDHQWVAARRYRNAQGVGHRRHSSHRLTMIDRMNSPSPHIGQLLRERRQIETRFAHLTNFGGGLTCLPPWVRGVHRVTLWVQGKIIVRLARDQQRRKRCA